MRTTAASREKGSGDAARGGFSAQHVRVLVLCSHRESEHLRKDTWLVKYIYVCVCGYVTGGVKWVTVCT